MDGLMFDTERVFIEAFDYAGEKCGVGKAGFMNQKTLGMSIRESRPLWVQEFGGAYNENEFRRYTKEFLQNYYGRNRVPIKKGLINLLDFLNSLGCKTAVASSSPHWEIVSHLKDAGIGIYNSFQVIVGGDMVSRTKPDPELYLTACEKLGEAPENCIALEDSKNGLFSAYKAGCKPVMVPDLWQPDPETERILYQKFADLDEVKAFLETVLI